MTAERIAILGPRSARHVAPEPASLIQRIRRIPEPNCVTWTCSTGQHGTPERLWDWTYGTGECPGVVISYLRLRGDGRPFSQECSCSCHDPQLAGILRPFTRAR